MKEGQSLTHGAEIYSAYLEESATDFVDEIEAQQLTREWLTFQFTLDSIKFTFKAKSMLIIEDFVRMQVFDAFVGNNDRHFYNWGVIEDVRHEDDPYFSPVYDTARGLFWNKSEKSLKRIVNKYGKIDDIWMKKYLEKAMPKIGWDNEKSVTHFELMNRLYSDYPDFREICHEIVNPT